MINLMPPSSDHTQTDEPIAYQLTIIPVLLCYSMMVTFSVMVSLQPRPSNMSISLFVSVFT